ncbi:MAG: DUF4149 domain-containing protein [Oxalicibacterium faecigallinarum]|uniref:TMEM205-like domain-containing protein n=1 Tax=Oxalicibacterium faecigallinarum TaxID=573741 RepID=A0A8J3ANM6_9BURK|nr:DUF4149 domain-containing protein [Oxalicibacterium faecigallinarum]MDQ7970676.1 DUF4149 domain-containing protein [Oxalicibacterium faecigallinarum]GGI16014.1 hypothetical protein GCM10008066_01840 [Oxalicibacterium faecigallinarum]
MLQSSRFLLATLWVGVLWAVGFVVAPTLFSTLADRSLAGSIAGSLFRITAWLSLGVGAALLIMQAVAERKMTASPVRATRYLVMAMMLCTVLGYFCLQPFMASLRETLLTLQDAVQIADARRQFGWLHGVSTVVYIVQSLLGAVLILKMR